MPPKHEPGYPRFFAALADAENEVAQQIKEEPDELTGFSSKQAVAIAIRSYSSSGLHPQEPPPPPSADNI